MNFLDRFKDKFLFLDGGLGTVLQDRGLQVGELPERWNLSHPEIITDIHREYYDAGSNIVSTNTFGANSLKFSSSELEAIIRAAIENAKAAREQSSGSQEKFIALDIGPTGKLLKPYGDFDFEEAVTVFAQAVRLGEQYGADLIFIETMNDGYETKAALLAAKENSKLPVFVTNAYSDDDNLLTGSSPEAMVAMLEGMHADAIGVNCSLGPKQLKDVVLRILKCSSIPVILKPNAGLPRSIDGRTVFDVLPEEFSEDVVELMKAGVRIAGGCCGTTPDYIDTLVKNSRALSPLPIIKKNISSVSSYTHALYFDSRPILIGERINPTGKKRFKQALIDNDMDYVLGEGLAQQEKGVDILDVNVGLPDIDEVKLLGEVVCELQAIIDLPLQIDSSDVKAMEAALRRYNGKAMINSVNGKDESMSQVFPLVKKYGGMVVALTLDEGGIPDTAEGRVKIARKILDRAAAYGIEKKDIIFDTLAMAISADSSAASATLEALSVIKNELGCHTSLGVSNVSFGLPGREAVNSTFFALALEHGLSAAIMNPHSADMMKTYFAYCALRNLDANCARYIDFISQLPQVEAVAQSAVTVSLNQEQEYKSELQMAVIKGLKDKAGALTGQLLSSSAPMDIVQNEIIPALDIVGMGFEKKTIYLPQLLMSAEAAKTAFEKIKSNVVADRANTKMAERCPFVIATVHGDIHDIGKNIVKLLLENYGFAVSDLGKDVPPENIVQEVVRTRAPLAGLSALMTTTVPAMEKTIAILRQQAPWCKVVVGGAVLNQEYADKIGADKYAKDAMETVRYAESIDDSLTQSSGLVL